MITITDSIHPREYSKGGVPDGILHETDSDGDLNVFNVERDGDDFWLNTNNGHPDNRWNADTRWVFVRRNSFHFSPGGFLGRVCCFCSCPLHPPSIFPISSIGKDSAIYFVSSIECVSQRIIRRMRSVSSFRMETRMNGNFSSREM